MSDSTAGPFGTPVRLVLIASTDTNRRELRGLGTLPPGLLDDVAAFLAGRLGIPCRTGPAGPDPRWALDPARGQLDARRLLASGLQRLAVVTGHQAGAVRDALAGLPVPALASALAYFDSYRRERLSADLIQAQRDYFGAHTYERVDQEGHFHFDWSQRA